MNIRDALEQMTEQEVNALYSAINGAGRGFAVGQEGHPLRDAAKEDEFTVWHSVGYGDNATLLMSNDIGECFLLGNANGPWAVPVEAEDFGEQGL